MGKNILLLMMSTLNDRSVDSSGLADKCSYFRENIAELDIEDGDFSEKVPNFRSSYIGQLEPVPFFLIEYLRAKGEGLDSIVVLGSKATKNNKIKARIKGSNNAQDEWTAEELFKNRVIEYGKENGETIEDEDIVFFNIDEYNRESVKEEIKKIIEHIREFRKNETSTDNTPGLNLWLDNHGGFRSVQNALQTIISILEIEGIIPKEIFTVEFSGNVGKIKTARDSFELMNYASGMHAFFDYGRLKKLETYFKNSTGDNLELLNHLVKISEHMELCDVKMLQAEFKKLKEFIDDKNDFEPELQIFIGNIYRDYGDLLSGKKEIIKRIKWCISKGFVQQAMAFIESWVPELMIQKNLLGYGQSDLNSMCDVKDKEKNVGQIKLGEAIKKAKGYKNTYNYFVDTINYFIERNEDNSACAQIYWKDQNSRREYHIEVEDKLSTTGNEKAVREFLELHRNLKRERNKIMHASEEPHKSMDELLIDIKNYIKKLEELLYNRT